MAACVRRGRDSPRRPSSSPTSDLVRVTGDIERMLADDGVTYTPPEQASGPWRLDPIPLVIDAAEWTPLEIGLAQRTELLNAILVDLYGPQRLLSTGVLPPSLVFGHSGFLRVVGPRLGPGPVAIAAGRGRPRPQCGRGVAGHRRSRPGTVRHRLRDGEPASHLAGDARALPPGRTAPDGAVLPGAPYDVDGGRTQQRSRSSRRGAVARHALGDVVRPGIRRIDAGLPARRGQRPRDARGCRVGAGVRSPRTRRRHPAPCRCRVERLRSSCARTPSSASPDCPRPCVAARCASSTDSAPGCSRTPGCSRSCRRCARRCSTSRCDCRRCRPTGVGCPESQAFVEDNIKDLVDSRRSTIRRPQPPDGRRAAATGPRRAAPLRRPGDAVAVAGTVVRSARHTAAGADTAYVHAALRVDLPAADRRAWPTCSRRAQAASSKDVWVLKDRPEDADQGLSEVLPMTQARATAAMVPRVLEDMFWFGRYAERAEDMLRLVLADARQRRGQRRLVRTPQVAPALPCCSVRSPRLSGSPFEPDRLDANFRSLLLDTRARGIGGAVDQLAPRGRAERTRSALARRVARVQLDRSGLGRTGELSLQPPGLRERQPHADRHPVVAGRDRQHDARSGLAHDQRRSSRRARPPAQPSAAGDDDGTSRHRRRSRAQQRGAHDRRERRHPSPSLSRIRTTRRRARPAADGCRQPQVAGVRHQRAARAPRRDAGVDRLDPS